jgi:hypothetical protein
MNKQLYLNFINLYHLAKVLKLHYKIEKYIKKVNDIKQISIFPKQNLAIITFS